jgi:hypothetical protein
MDLMAKSVGIIAYGTRQDREKLDAIARLGDESGSSWIIKRIRQEYDRIFSQPKEVDSGHQDARPRQV